jgi:hypothetical protein
MAWPPGSHMAALCSWNQEHHPYVRPATRNGRGRLWLVLTHGEQRHD